MPTDGLVGWWPFNGNANDESGNGNNGTVNGATLTEDRFGMANKSYNFNALNWSSGSGGDYIYIPFDTIFNSDMISVSLWMWRNSTLDFGLGQRPIARFEGGYNNPNGQQWQLAISEPNAPIISSVVYAPSSNNDQNYMLISGETYGLNVWQNVTFTLENGNFKQYLNGLLIADTSIADFELNTNSSSGISIGLSIQANGNWHPFDGKLDDIAIYNRALSPEEITALYTGEPANPTTACNPLPSNLQNGLVGYWPFCGNANDESGNGNNGTVNGATLTEDRFGNANAAYDFDGVDDFIYTQIDSALEQDWSVNFWFKSTNPNNNFQGQNLIGLGPDVYGYGSAGLQISGQIEPGQCPSFAYLNQLYLFDASEECGGNFLNGGLYDSSQWHNVSILKNNLEYEIIIDNMSVSTAVLNDININVHDIKWYQ